MKKVLFKKGIAVIYFPFMLTDISPWQQQVAREMLKCKETYSVRKSARWGYQIEDGRACITLWEK